MTSVVAELERKGQQYFIYDPGTFPRLSKIIFESFQRTTNCRLYDNGRVIDLSAIKSIWYRRPGQFGISKDLGKEQREWLLSECRHFFKGIWANTNALWVSEPWKIDFASLKLYQLRYASHLGLKIPKTIVTNCPVTSRAFIRRNSNGTIVKVLAEPCIVYEGEERAEVLYTHLIKSSDYKHLGAVKFGPTLFQEFIEKERDIRVTVIGERLYAVSIDARGNEQSRVDFRNSSFFDLPHESIKLPYSVARRCVRLVEKLGLKFGAIDLIKKGADYYFLEINPNGQWLWLEKMTGQPLSKAIAELLTHGH